MLSHVSLCSSVESCVSDLLELTRIFVQGMDESTQTSLPSKPYLAL